MTRPKLVCGVIGYFCRYVFNIFSPINWQYCNVLMRNIKFCKKYWNGNNNNIVIILIVCMNNTTKSNLNTMFQFHLKNKSIKQCLEILFSWVNGLTIQILHNTMLTKNDTGYIIHQLIKKTTHFFLCPTYWQIKKW